MSLQTKPLSSSSEVDILQSIGADKKPVISSWFGLKPKDYGLHSMRSGGASLAAALGIPDRLIMRHGGWKSETSKNRYISESKISLLHVSGSLSLGVSSA